MKIILTGGAGDLGTLLCPEIKEKGFLPVVLDIFPPGSDIEFRQVSIIERDKLKDCFKDCSIIVHIAAWHGVHEHRKEKSVYDFFDLNVAGTFNVFQTALESGIDKILFISSTSIDDRFSIYGHTKFLGKGLARAYTARHKMNILTLRPRAFIPHWNRHIYKNYLEWAQWFWGGAVHIDDVAQAVLKGIEYLSAGTPSGEPLFLTVDGAYEYTDEDLKNWDKDGPGSTFKRHYPEYYELALEYGLDPSRKPKKLDISETQRVLKYEPEYSLKSLLKELSEYGAEGPQVKDI